MERSHPTTGWLPALRTANRSLARVCAAFSHGNTVPTSPLKIQYGGLYNSASGQVNSGITVDFSNDLAPGVVAVGGPITYAGPNNGQFVPILRSTIRIQSDMSLPATACS